MDSLDMKILKELVRNNVMPFPAPALHKSFRAIGRNLGIDQGTVRNRLQKFRQNGMLKEFYLGVNPSLFGLKIGVIWFDVRPPSEKENIKKQVSGMEKILLICDYLGPKLSTVFCYTNKEEFKKTTRRIIRVANSEDVISFQKPFLRCDNKLKLTPSDWRIIYSLQQGDPFTKSYSIVSRETRLSAKTVKKRIGTMVEEGAVYPLARLNLASFEGFVPVDLNIFYESAEFRDRVNEDVRDYLGESLVFADLDDAHHGYYALAVPSVTRVRQIQDWLKNYKGIMRVNVEILHDIMSLRRFYDQRVRIKVDLSIAVPNILRPSD